MINLSSGRSEKDRISFFTKDSGITAIKSKNGKINFKMEIAEEEATKNSAIVFILLAIFSLPAFIKSILLIPLINNNNISIIWYLLPAFFYTSLMILCIILVRKDGGKEFLRNHGAEHMVYAAYKMLKRPPSIQEAMQYSRIANSCGVTIFSGFITAQIIGFIIYACTGIRIFEIILLSSSIFFHSFFPFNLIGKLAQFFTTSKPKKKNLRLAILSISALEIIEVFGKDEISALNNGEHKIQIK